MHRYPQWNKRPLLLTNFMLFGLDHLDHLTEDLLKLHHVLAFFLSLRYWRVFLRLLHVINIGPGALPG